MLAPARAKYHFHWLFLKPGCFFSVSVPLTTPAFVPHPESEHYIRYPRRCRNLALSSGLPESHKSLKLNIYAVTHILKQFTQLGAQACSLSSCCLSFQMNMAAHCCNLCQKTTVWTKLKEYICLKISNQSMCVRVGIFSKKFDIALSLISTVWVLCAFANIICCLAINRQKFIHEFFFLCLE